MANLPPKKILIIDDTEVNRYSVGRILSNAGYETAEAASIAQGIEMLDEYKPDMLVLDVKLPDGNGFEFCARLKSDPGMSSLPILMTSASFVDGRDRAYGLEIGADGYLTTPYDQLELVATVRSLLRISETEDKLRKSQELFLTLANSIPALVWMAGTDKLYYYFNKAWCDFTGRTLEEESGTGWTEGVHPDDLESCQEIYHDNFDKRQSFEMNYRLKRHDGDYRWILDRGEPHYNLDGSFAGYTGACIDIHDKLITEHRLQESEERFALAMRGMNDGLWDWDVSTGSIYYAPRYKSMLGYHDDEFPNTIAAWHDHLHPEDAEKAKNVATKYIAGATSEYRNIFRLRHKNGEYRWILSRALGIRDEMGKVCRLVGAHTDITAQKELETELRDASERAEAANRAKTEFLANMSHEIRTPMNAIIGLTYIMAKTPLTEKQKKFVDTLQLSADSMMALINDMLDISKIEDQMIQLEFISFSLRELMERILSMMAVKANEKSLDLKVEYGEEVGDSYVGDPVRLQQIIVNLISNAIKFTAQGNVHIYIDAQKAGTDDMQKITIRVKDTGIGIAKDKQYAIFDKFTQADSSITRKFGGTGLGLTICKALVERMGGNINVASEVGIGSVFTVNILLKGSITTETTEADDDRDIVSTPQQMNRKHILLVEDYKANVLVATSILSELGYHYEVATDGQEALNKIKSMAFDAVLMDIQMQPMDGYEATRRIREWEEKEGRKPVAIIAMTAHALTGDREKCMEMGMNDYISKPFSPNEMESKLAVYIKKSAAAA